MPRGRLEAAGLTAAEWMTVVAEMDEVRAVNLQLRRLAAACAMCLCVGVCVRVCVCCVCVLCVCGVWGVVCVCVCVCVWVTTGHRSRFCRSRRRRL